MANLWQAFDEDLLLTNIMLYFVEGSFVTSTWMYRGRMPEGSGTFPAGTRIKVPTGVAAFPDPVIPPPRSRAGQTEKIVHRTEMAAGGPFAALEQPELLLADRRRFFADQASSKGGRLVGNWKLQVTLTLSLLAPEIQQAIPAGRQPRSLNLERLIHGDVPAQLGGAAKCARIQRSALSLFIRLHALI